MTVHDEEDGEVNIVSSGMPRLTRADAHRLARRLCPEVFAVAEAADHLERVRCGDARWDPDAWNAHERAVRAYREVSGCVGSGFGGTAAMSGAEPEPGDTIWEGDCPSCGAHLDVHVPSDEDRSHDIVWEPAPGPEPELPDGCEWVGSTLVCRGSELRVYVDGDLIVDDGNLAAAPVAMVRTVLARHEREVGR